ncbi:hypothetical protein RRG08_045055 [Elysia crispata]|uniref:Uncharacterized protein n=1 Tax=Elysia crispata TaxID=231223 RepID=A0AAE0XTW2_9GAST|nr:hypothetical protein RRG08_045055 [Elysia crispata]
MCGRQETQGFHPICLTIDWPLDHNTGHNQMECAAAVELQNTRKGISPDIPSWELLTEQQTSAGLPKLSHSIKLLSKSTKSSQLQQLQTLCFNSNVQSFKSIDIDMKSTACSSLK